MTPDYRALCAELVQAMTDDSAGCWHREHDVLAKARLALAAEPVPVPEGPTVMEIIELSNELDGSGDVELVRAALSRWGRQPVASLTCWN